MKKNIFLLVFFLSSIVMINIIPQEILSQTSSSLDENIIKLLVDKVDGDWVWLLDNDTENQIINPTLEISPNVPTNIQIKGTGGTHNFIIETSDGEELEKTEDFGDDNIELSFIPNVDDTNIPLTYYCEYHKDTMKGEIIVK